MSLVPSSLELDSVQEGTGVGILGFIATFVALCTIGLCLCKGGPKDTSKVVVLPSGVTVRYGGPNK